MGAGDILSGKSDMSGAREERERRVSPPEFAPGQGEISDSFDFDDIFDNSGTSLDLGGGGDLSNYGAFPAELGGNNMPTQKQELTEDEIFDKAVAGMKAIGNGIKYYIDALKNTTSKFWAKFEAYL
ncbi:MAG: hypothetical protein LBM93_10075, partial [Oscillospiraceae bacterium]|nr:hypothetical protein [Oscillospiraceae bacterium]